MSRKRKLSWWSNKTHIWNFQPNGRWLSGPSFLQHPEETWPTEELISSAEDHSEEEIKKEFIVCISNHTTRRTIIDFSRFSNYNRLKCKTAWLFRYKNNLFRKSKGQSLVLNEITSDEIQLAELYLCSEVQKDAYRNEFLELEKCGHVSKESDTLLHACHSSQEGQFYCQRTTHLRVCCCLFITEGSTILIWQQ